MKVLILEEIPLETRGEAAFVLQKGAVYDAVPMGKKHITFFAHGEKICLESHSPSIKIKEK